MINDIRLWCEGIIIALIISVIIELLVPEGNNKKYVKVVVGVYIIFVIINPILKLINKDFDFNFEKFGITNETEETISLIDNNMKNVYIIGIEQTIKQEIENLGYKIGDVKVCVDSKYENIESIEIKVQEKINNNEIYIEKITIGEESITKEKISYQDIIDYLSENYLLEENQIIFK